MPDEIVGCPQCGCACVVDSEELTYYSYSFVKCNGVCGYRSRRKQYEVDAIAYHNAHCSIMQTLRHADNEITDSPYWLIIDPSQMMKPDVGWVAHMIEGPFFSREDAEHHMKEERPHAFSDHARVYCCSGYRSTKYKEFCKAIRKG